MHPQEFWLFYEAKMQGVETPDDKWADLYQMVKEQRWPDGE